MRFTIASHLLSVDGDLRTTVVDTETELEEPRVSYSDWWLLTGDERFDPLIKCPVQLSVLERNQSGIFLCYVIWGGPAACMFAISGKNSADDQKIVQTFRERCQEFGWISQHAACTVPVPGMYLLADPGQDSLSDDSATGLMSLAKHVTAGFFRQVGLPV
jgi:hypothetical protein